MFEPDIEVEAWLRKLAGHDPQITTIIRFGISEGQVIEHEGRISTRPLSVEEQWTFCFRMMKDIE